MRGIALVLAATVAFSSAPASAAAFVETFDSYTPGVPWNGSGVWTTSNSVDLVATGQYGLTCAGGNCVDLTGNSPGAISTVLNLAAGLYTLTFQYTGNQLASQSHFPQTGFDFSVGDLAGSVGPLANDSATFLTYTNTFTSTGAPVTLTFAQQAGGDTLRGSILDNVSISASAVPEPATWGMMIAGFGLMGVAMRRRRAKLALA